MAHEEGPYGRWGPIELVKANGDKVRAWKSAASGDWYVTVKARNGRIRSTTEGYERRSTARREAERLSEE